MRRISAMYQWSGGTLHDEICGNCKNFVRYTRGKRSYFKCKCYGESASVATDWRKNYIACKAFNSEPPERPLIETGITRDIQVIGQMSLSDFM